MKKRKKMIPIPCMVYDITKAHNGLGSEEKLKAKIFFVILAAYPAILAEKNEYRNYYIYFYSPTTTPAVSWQAQLLPEKFHCIFFHP